MHYKKHIFFCLNQRDDGKKCCNDAGATDMWAYTKQRIADLGLAGSDGVRVNKAGCMGRCKKGPCVVIYPEGVWYTYANKKDLDEIIKQHVMHDRIVHRLLIDGA